MVFNGKELCENCFSPMTSGRCESCGFSLEDHSPDPTVLAVGAILQNRYRIGGIIGKGGFGVTYLAFDTKLERRIAVKEYFPYGLALRGTGTGSVMTTVNAQVFKKGAEKFYDEARLIAKFNSTGNIVNVYDVFYENDTVYYVMEYLRGQTIKSYTENGGRLSPGQAVYIAGEIAGALGIAHEMNVLHRDITPDNIMLCPDNKVKLIDFGAARQVVSEGSQSLSVILTQGFAPLEQYQKKGKQGPWTDIYSLGASIYYGMTGEIIDDPMSRFEDDTAFQSNPCAITGELWEIIKKAVAIKTADRYQNASELRNALGAISIQPEKIDIPRSEIKIKAAQGTVFRTGITSEKPVPQPEPMATIPVSGSSDMRTQPVSQSEQMRTMPVKDSSQMRTMAVNEEQTAADEKEKKKRFAPIIAGAAALVLIVGAIIAVSLNGGSDDDIAFTDETETASISETEKETQLAEAEEDEPKETATVNSTEQDPPPTTAAMTNPEEPNPPPPTDETSNPLELTLPPTTDETSKPTEQKPPPTTEETSKPTEQKPPVTTAATTKPAEQKPPVTTTAAKTPAASEIGWKKMNDIDLKLTYELPDGYVKDSNSDEFFLCYTNAENDSSIFVEFLINRGYPICSYKDVPGGIDEILDSLQPAERSHVQGEYFNFTDGRGGWRYVFQIDYNGSAYNCICNFVDSKTKLGCYIFYADYMVGDAEAEEISLKFLNSISITGSPNDLLADTADVYRGNPGANADVGFFYYAPDCTLEGGNGKPLYIKKSSSEYVEIYVNNQSMEAYCYSAGIDEDDIMTETYDNNTFDYIIEESYYDNEWNYTHIYSMDVGGGRHLKVVVNTTDEDLTWTVENHILPYIHVYN